MSIGNSPFGCGEKAMLPMAVKSPAIERCKASLGIWQGLLHQVNPDAKSRRRLQGDFRCVTDANPMERPAATGCSAPSEAGAAARRRPENPGPETGGPRNPAAARRLQNATGG